MSRDVFVSSAVFLIDYIQHLQRQTSKSWAEQIKTKILPDFLLSYTLAVPTAINTSKHNNNVPEDND